MNCNFLQIKTYQNEKQIILCQYDITLRPNITAHIHKTTANLKSENKNGQNGHFAIQTRYPTAISKFF